jgi:hypothetical protein
MTTESDSSFSFIACPSDELRIAEEIYREQPQRLARLAAELEQSLKQRARHFLPWRKKKGDRWAGRGPDSFASSTG